MNNLLAKIVAGNDIGKGLFLMIVGVCFIFIVQLLFYMIIKLFVKAGNKNKQKT